MESEELPETQELPQTQQFTQSRNSVGTPVKQMGVLLVDFEREYPIMMGATVIGRDPVKCDIVIDDDTVSKMHAIIRIKKPNEFFIIDMKSTNGTKCKSKPLMPHFATPFHYDDKLEFGSVFALLRPSMDNSSKSPDDLPMTQVLDTPASHRPALASTLRQITVPESPDVSDRDEDSFAIPRKPISSRSITPKNRSNNKMNENNNDSLFWKAPSRSPSLKFELNDSTNSLNDSDPTIPNNSEEIVKVSINDMDTQIPEEAKMESLHNLETQLLEGTGIHTMETQVSENATIHTWETQLPTIDKIHEAETQIPSKETNESCETETLSIYEAQTQMLTAEHENDFTKNTKDKCTTYISESDEEILFEELDTQGFEIPSSQPLLNDEPTSEGRSNEISTSTKLVLKSDENNKLDPEDCKHLSVGPKNEWNDSEEDLTDCEDEIVKENENKENVTNLMICNMNLTEPCSNLNVVGLTPRLNDEKNTNAEPVFKINSTSCKNVPEEATKNQISEISELPTQIITEKNEDDISDMLTQVIETNEDLSEEPTQVIVETIEEDGNTENSDEATQCLPEISEDILDAPTQVIVEEEKNISPFKIPINRVFMKGKSSPCLSKSHISRSPLLGTSCSTLQKTMQEPVKVMNPSDYYNCTQEVVDDLLTQREVIVKENNGNPFKIPSNLTKISEIHKLNKYGNQNEPAKTSSNYYQCTQDLENDLQTQNQDIVPNSQDDDKVGERYPHITKNLPLNNTSSITDKTQDKFRLSSQQVRDIIGVSDKAETKSDGTSDTDDTPKKVIGFYDDLPLSEDIVERKVCGSSILNPDFTLSEDEKSADERSDSDSPIVFRNRKTTKSKVKVNLTSRLNLDNLPTRISSRNRKPAAKVKDNSELCRTISNQLEDNVELEIVKENLKKMKDEKSNQNSSQSGVAKKSKIQPQNSMNTKKSEESNKLKRDNYTENKKMSNKPASSRASQSSKITKKNAESELISSDKKMALELVAHTNTRIKRNIDKKSQEIKKKNVVELLSTDSDENVKPSLVKRSRKRGKNNKPIKVSTDTEAPLPHIKTEKGRNSPPKEVRRSSRKKISVETEPEKKSPNDKKEKPNSEKQSHVFTRNSEDKSRVYSMAEQSTDSSFTESKPDSTNIARSSRRKRVANEVVHTPSKRLRSSFPDTSDSNLAISGSQRVLFTAYNDDRKKNMLLKLGATVVDDVKSCTVVVTKEIKRTFKFLCAVGLGLPIVGDSWVKACEAKQGFVDPWSHILVDAAAEKRFGFSLRRTLRGPRAFLAGCHVTSTPSVLPVAAEMKLIVECSGGTYAEGGRRWLAVSAARDAARWAALRRRGATVVSREIVLAGVLRQRLEVEAHVIV